ncbi:hypothetical protein BU23DRAFT_492864 [Bimuria novae-zelandiae CBS 107.79]|uniref:Uncharacterized protein n=1 Tax=Bimuria novae-zelandiae CBS 107.79 TaxID=1447943 RepID=A0A6A5UGN3_9PLEO|nr:hypothetical protein BU23DRAFT_492864 [Bimuria novae-zelandiae CBS 107.79]
MRSYPVVLVLYLAALVWAGGYQGCMERVHLYEAYQIDEFNAPADRIVGFKCRRWLATGGCQDDDWIECRGRNGGRCTFDELVIFISLVPDRNANGYSVLKPGTNRLDQRPSALACYQRYFARNTPIRNFHPKDCIKTDVDEFNDYIKRLSEHLNRTYARLRPTLTPAQNALYSDLEYTQDRIIEARAGDHGPYV